MSLELTVFVLWLLFTLWKSIYLIQADEMLSSWLLTGTFRKTYVPGSYYEGLTTNADRAKAMESSRPGHFGGDFVFQWWPFIQVLRFPTIVLKIPIHINQVYTASGGKTEPRVRLEIKATLMLRLAPKVLQLVQAFKIWRSPYRHCLGMTIVVKDSKGHEWQLPAICAVLMEGVQEPIFEAMRTAAVQYTWGGKQDIVTQKTNLERAVKWWLAEPESIFVQGGILKKRHPKDTTPKGAAPPKLGEAVISFDFIIERITPEPKRTTVNGVTTEEPSAFETAIDAIMIANLEGEAEAIRQEKKREGEGRGLKKKAAMLDTEEAQELARLEAVRDATSNTTFNVYGGERAAEVLKSFFGGKNPPTNPPSSGPTPPTGGTP